MAKKKNSFCGQILIFLKENWVLIVILLVATFLRFYNLSELPPGLYPDEAANGLDIIRMKDDGDFRAIYDTNGPRESLFFFGQGKFVIIGDILNITAWEYTPLSLRIAPAIIGVLTVLGIYLLSKEFFKSKELGLISAGVLAVSSWHIQFSRNGFRAIMLPLALTLIFYFFIRAYREGRLKDYILFGITLGLGFYTYLSIRMLPLVFGAFLIWTFLFDKNFIKENLKKILISIGVFLLVMIPLFMSFASDITLLAGRASTSIFNPELNNGSALKTFFDNIIAELKMFNIAGDKNFRHNFGGSPMLDIAVGIFFWIGAAISLINWKKIEHFILIMLFGAMSLPMILTAEGIPHALRLVGVIPIVFIWVSLGLKWLADKINSKKLKTFFIVFVILLSAAFGFKKYFIDFANNTAAHDAYTEDMVSIAYDLRENGQNRENILVAGEFGTKTIDFMIYGRNIHYNRYETYDLYNSFKLPEKPFKIYVQKDWFDETQSELNKLGYFFDFAPVKSEFDGRIIYYEFEEK